MTIGSINVDITNTRLYGDGSTQFGILDKTIAIAGYGADSGNAPTVETTAVDFATADDTITFNVTPSGGSTTLVTIDQTTLANAGLSDTKIRSNGDLVAVLNQALTDAGVTGITASVDATSGNVAFTSASDFTIGGATDAGTDTITVTRPWP